MTVLGVAADPRHYTHRDGRILPVHGTHTDGEVCTTCETGRTPARVLASSFALGTLVSWPYGHGAAHGRVVEHGRTRVRVHWHSRRPRSSWLPAKRITARIAKMQGCTECAGGR